MSAPLYIFYGNGDKLVAPEDVKTLAATMPSTEAIYQIDYEGWNHNDFVYGDLHIFKILQLAIESRDLSQADKTINVDTS